MSWIDHLRICEACARTGAPGRHRPGWTYRPPGDTRPCEWCGGELVPVDPNDCPARRRGEFCAVCAALFGTLPAGRS